MIILFAYNIVYAAQKPNIDKIKEFYPVGDYACFWGSLGIIFNISPSQLYYEITGNPGDEIYSPNCIDISAGEGMCIAQNLGGGK